MAPDADRMVGTHSAGLIIAQGILPKKRMETWRASVSVDSKIP